MIHNAGYGIFNWSYFKDTEWRTTEAKDTETYRYKRLERVHGLIKISEKLMELIRNTTFRELALFPSSGKKKLKLERSGGLLNWVYCTQLISVPRRPK
jgi:hypothetical protein